ncbi:MAG: hypothetical protein JNK29_04175, partial [Anaerolineales bacterium]|nr:hypothetical protein [Anaerolineales bacterium]
LSVQGLGLTFAALGMLILLIIGLQRAFAVGSVPAPAPAPLNTSARDSEAEEIAAAICIALSHLRALEICESGLGDALTDGRGPWWQPAADAPAASLRRSA